MQSNIKTQVAITYTLSNGVIIKTGNSKRNRTGYTGAAFSPAWTLDPKKPFLAACSNPEDTATHLELGTERSLNKRSNWHGGSYADAREAAYVVGLFKLDPINTDRAVHEGTITFPEELYDLPSGMSLLTAMTRIDAANRRALRIKKVKAGRKLQAAALKIAANKSASVKVNSIKKAA